MSGLKGFTVDAVTGESIIAELDKEELAFIEKIKNEAKEINNFVLAQQEARISAIAKIAALGLTE
jgi:hypothetical protein